MLRPFARVSTAVSIAAAITLCSVAVGQATTQLASTKYDTSYQNAGVLLLPQMPRTVGQIARTCDVSGDHLNIAGRFGPSATGGYGKWSTTQKLATTSIKLTPRQPMMLGIAEVSWHTQRIPTDHSVVSQDFDSGGGFAYVTRSVKKGNADKFKIFRVLPNGRRDAKFGNNGYVSVTVAGLKSTFAGLLRVIALPGSKVQFMVQTPSNDVILRFKSTGKPDAGWGSGGVVTLPPARTKLNGPNYGGAPPLDAATPTPDGGLLVAANQLPGGTASGVLGLVKLSNRGKVDVEWGDKGFWRPPAPKVTTYGTLGQTVLTSIRKGGDYAVLYGDSVDRDGSGQVDLKLAYVDSDSGVTTLFNDKAASYPYGGDGGAPDDNPWIMRESASGTIFGYAGSEYGAPGGTFGGEATRFSADTDKAVNTATISNSGFATGAFAVDPKAKYLYFCGAEGVTSKRTKIVANREQRKAIAIRRVKL